MRRKSEVRRKSEGGRRSLGISLVAVLWILVLVLLGSTGRSTAASPEKVRLSLAGASTGTWTYMFCATIADTWRRYIPGMDITVLATAGSTANYIPLTKGELDLAAGSSTADWYATHGLYFTKSKLTNFCAVLTSATAFIHLFTYAEFPIHSYKDLEGKRVLTAARASPGSINAEEICTALGIKPKFVYASPSEGVDMVKDRRVDAMLYGTGAPWSAILDIATDRKIRFISMTPQEQKKVNSDCPQLTPMTLRAKTYAFQTEDVLGMGSYQTVNARSGLSGEIVYRLTKTAWERWDEVGKALPAAKSVKPSDIVNLTVPIHPGAAKYYKEIGIQIPDRLLWKKN